jgi:hypothetical protein
MLDFILYKMIMFPLYSSFGMRLNDGERREWLKPIMFSGGIGQIDHAHLHKNDPQVRVRFCYHLLSQQFEQIGMLVMNITCNARFVSYLTFHPRLSHMLPFRIPPLFNRSACWW